MFGVIVILTLHNFTITFTPINKKEKSIVSSEKLIVVDFSHPGTKQERMNLAMLVDQKYNTIPPPLRYRGRRRQVVIVRDCMYRDFVQINVLS
jgi:hypothetical protein